jgi:hypothetical protein
MASRHPQAGALGLMVGGAVSEQQTMVTGDLVSALNGFNREWESEMERFARTRTLRYRE